MSSSAFCPSCFLRLLAQGSAGAGNYHSPTFGFTPEIGVADHEDVSDSGGDHDEELQPRPEVDPLEVDVLLQSVVVDLQSIYDFG